MARCSDPTLISTPAISSSRLTPTEEFQTTALTSSASMMMVPALLHHCFRKTGVLLMPASHFRQDRSARSEPGMNSQMLQGNHDHGPFDAPPVSLPAPNCSLARTALFAGGSVPRQAREIAGGLGRIKRKAEGEHTEDDGFVKFPALKEAPLAASPRSGAHLARFDEVLHSRVNPSSSKISAVYVAPESLVCFLRRPDILSTSFVDLNPMLPSSVKPHLFTS